MKSRVSCCIASRRFSSKSGNSSTSGTTPASRPQLQPLAAEVVDQRLRPRIAQHPPHLPFQHDRILQGPAHRHVEQFVVGDPAPEKERQARGEIDRVEAIRCAGRHVRRFALDTKQKARRRENAAQCRAGFRPRTRFPRGPACRSRGVSGPPARSRGDDRRAVPASRGSSGRTALPRRAWPAGRRRSGGGSAYRRGASPRTARQSARCRPLDRRSTAHSSSSRNRAAAAAAPLRAPGTA